MANTGQLLFGNLPSVPILWMIGLLGFVALWWYVCRNEGALRRLFLALWLPAAVLTAAIYSLDGRGYAVGESLSLLMHRDPAVLHAVHWLPTNGFDATYALIAGGTAAALATMALHLAGILLGVVVSIAPPARRGGRRN